MPWNTNAGPRGSEEFFPSVGKYLKPGRGRFLVLAFALVLLAASTGLFTVDPHETGVIQRFGKVVRTSPPGLHFKLPRGIESVQLVPTARVLKDEFGFRTVASRPGERSRYTESKAYMNESLMLTGDLNVIDVQWIIQYRIEDPIGYLFRLRDTHKTVRDITEAVMRRVVGNRLGGKVLTVDRVAISTEAKHEIQEILSGYGAGVRLVTVELQDVTPPEKVKPAFNEVNEARQDKERTINQAQEQVNREVPRARGVAQQKIRQAEGYALERVNRALGEAARFESIFAEYRQAPEVTRRRMYLEVLGGYLAGSKAVYVVDEQQKALVPWLPVEPRTAPDSSPLEGGRK